MCRHECVHACMRVCLCACVCTRVCVRVSFIHVGLSIFFYLFTCLLWSLWHHLGKEVQSVHSSQWTLFFNHLMSSVANLGRKKERERDCSSFIWWTMDDPFCYQILYPKVNMCNDSVHVKWNGCTLSWSVRHALAEGCAHPFPHPINHS